MTTTMAPVSETFTVTEEIMVRAPIERTFASVVAQLGRLEPRRPTANLCRWCSKHALVAAGSATLAPTMATCGVSFRALRSVQHSSRFGDRCSCQRRQHPTCCIG